MFHSGRPGQSRIRFCNSIDFMDQVFEALIIFRLASQGLLLVTSKNHLDICLKLGRKCLEFVILCGLGHAFWSCEDQSDKSRLSLKEEINSLCEKVHFSLLLVEEQRARLSDLIIRVSYFCNNEIEEDDRHGENIDEPEDPNDSMCHCAKNRVIGLTDIPGIELDGDNVSDRVPENLDESTEGRVHVFVLLILDFNSHDKVHHGEDIYIKHEDGHESR